MFLSLEMLSLISSPDVPFMPCSILCLFFFLLSLVVVNSGLSSGNNQKLLNFIGGYISMIFFNLPLSEPNKKYRISD